MKQITIAGGIGKDAELRRTQKGDPVAGFSVGVSRSRNDETTWFDVSIWGARAEKLTPFLTKGSKVTVSGEFGTREHNGKTYLTINANDVALQGGGQSRDNSGSGNQGGGDQSPQGGGYGGGGSQGGGRGDLDDEIPFACEWRI